MAAPTRFARERVTVTTGAAIGLTKATFDNFDVAEITVDDNAIAFTLDGTAPVVGGGSGGKGHAVAVGSGFTLLNRHEMEAFKAIASTGTAYLEVTYKKRA